MGDSEPRSEPSSGPSTALSPEVVPDERAELRDQIAQIRDAPSLPILSALLVRLLALLERRFAWEEGDAGDLRALAGDAANRMGSEHRDILAAIRDLISRAQLDTSRPVAAVDGEVAALLARLLRHDAGETDLLVHTPGVERAGPLLQGAYSDALEVNLRRTAVHVVIPEDQQVLLELTASRYGVQENTKKLLREINHPYVNWFQTLDDLHRRAMGDFAHYVKHERVAQAVEVFCSLYDRVAEKAPSPSLREAAVRNQLSYLEKVVRDAGEALARILPALEGALDMLEGVLGRDPRQAVVASPRLRHFADALRGAAPAAEGVAERSLGLLAFALRHVYEEWLEREDPAGWWREGAGAVPGTPLPDKVAAISHERFAAHRDAIDELAGGGGTLQERAEVLLSLPDQARIERSYLDAAASLDSEAKEPWENQLERIRWLIKLLSVEALGPVHEQALSEINHAYLDVLRAGDRHALELVVRETFSRLRHSELAFSPTALNLIAKIGEQALATGDRDWAEIVIGELLDWDFPTPGFSGFTDDWKVQVNPAHLRAMRAYLSVIEANPELARRLVAALVVHLEIGGIFVADTDLFQKDVSKLLNSGVGPVYHTVKHLLKIFPVYFHDIGAEGELRDVSSRIDELEERHDPLCHFLRKQCHVESNPLLIDFIEAIAHFWATGEREPLRPYVPAPLFDRLDPENEEQKGLHEVFARMVGGREPRSFFDAEPADFEHTLSQVTDGSPIDREKARLLFRLRKLIGQKYELDHDDLLDRLRGFHRIPEEQIETLQRTLLERRDEEALQTLVSILERLKGIIVSEERTEGVEDIYYKRHIAVGIPSMYGRYREEKFEAVGLTFRIESLANVLFERMVAEQELRYVTKSTLRKVARWLRLMLRAIRIDGCTGRAISTGISMLDQALLAEGVSIDQYVNIFQFTSHAVEKVIRIRFLDVYETILDRVLQGMIRRGLVHADAGSDPQETILKVSETFLRDRIAQSFALQQLDTLVGKVLQSLQEGRERFDHDTLNVLMSYDGDRCFAAIDGELGPLDGAIYLGNKGYMIKRLAREGISVPPGFIITTEFYRCLDAIRSCDDLQHDVTEQLHKQIARLERRTGARFGDPKHPLLLSVRSSATISMPGVLDTFLNVGLSETVAAGFAARSGSAWGAWDAYRRFLQFWGMAHGLDRDVFDAMMREAKQEFGVEKKSHMPDQDMKALALRYRQLLLDHSVKVTDDPYEQLATCVDLVLDSWHSEKARIYRSETQIAEEWGTSVIVQSMVYGNLNERSGTGVTLTRDPRRASDDVRLFGDFILQGQGEDVVSGLVDTFPISEEQRLSLATSATMSLEKDVPRIYEALYGHARTLIRDQGMYHQEIEFTFESDEPDNLYILQTRDAVMASVTSVPAFVPTEALERAKVATGIGVGGGALSGRVALTAEDIVELRHRYREEPIILLRPDTVPDDIPLLLQADGMVTAIGGATSHAAVVAQRLGRTCVVGCRQLHVDEAEKRSDLGGLTLKTGDLLSINGSDGSIYLGKHPYTIVSRQGLV
jgi:pyruvate,orthophosphate dikinase